METKRFEFVLEAARPIAHHAETLGNEAILRRREIRLPGGTFVRVPEVSGDAMRHGLRESAAYAFLDAAGLLEEGAEALSEAALRLLFAGGMVTGKGASPSINLEAYRKMCDLFPPLKLLGGCTDNRITPGMMNVDGALLLCAETLPSIQLTSPWILAWLEGRGEVLSSARSHVDEEGAVRMDPTLIPEKMALLSPEAKANAVRRLERSETAHAEGNDAEQMRSKSSMMPRRIEVVKQGSLFAWGVEARCFTPLDVDTLLVMCFGFLSHAYVGGKRGAGKKGWMVPVAAHQMELARPALQGEAIVPAMMEHVGARFREHVGARREAIREMLRTVVA